MPAFSFEELSEVLDEEENHNNENARDDDFKRCHNTSQLRENIANIEESSCLFCLGEA
jgi:hypothetical protein